MFKKPITDNKAVRPAVWMTVGVVGVVTVLALALIRGPISLDTLVPGDASQLAQVPSGVYSAASEYGAGAYGSGPISNGSGPTQNGSGEVTPRDYTFRGEQEKVVMNRQVDKEHRFRITRRANQCDVRKFASILESDVRKDANWSYPFGLFGIELECVDKGSTVTKEIILDDEYDTTGWELRKYNATNDEYSTINAELVTYATENGRTIIRYDVTDGGELDEDGEANGVIIDPVGVAIKEGGGGGEEGGESIESGGGQTGGGRGGRSSGGSQRVTPAGDVAIPNNFTFRKNISFIQPQFNEADDVRYLKQFLNAFENENLVVDGVYRQEDSEAVKRFQRKYAREILDIWGLTEATGYVGITTRMKMNFILQGRMAQCPAFTEYNGGLSGIKYSAEIGRTQEVLRDLDMYVGPINNTWDAATNRALITFQETFREVMLDPWNITKGTGYKYKTTNKFLNYLVGCRTGAVYLEGVGYYEGI